MSLLPGLRSRETVGLAGVAVGREFSASDRNLSATVDVLADDRWQTELVQPPVMLLLSGLSRLRPYTELPAALASSWVLGRQSDLQTPELLVPIAAPASRWLGKSQGNGALGQLTEPERLPDPTSSLPTQHWLGKIATATRQSSLGRSHPPRPTQSSAHPTKPQTRNTPRLYL